MQAAPLPIDELERLAALRALKILDTPAETVFDHITRLAAHLLHVPIALVSLVDEKRQWFKSRHGLAAPETARDLAFCAHVLNQDGPLLVPDAHADARFADNPLVLNEPNVRFYLGVPITSVHGFKLGTLCAIDTQARQASAEEVQLLESLAATAEGLLHARELALETQQLMQARELDVRARLEAEATAQLKSRFLANMSHEIRTPLNGIVGMTDLLIETRLAAQQFEYAKIIQSCGAHLLKVVNEVLDFSAIEAGKVSLSLQPLNLREWLTSQVDVFRASAVAKHLTLGLEVMGDVPEWVMGDGPRMAQMLLNYLGNAVKFTQHGGVRVRLLAPEKSAAGVLLRVEVQDTGIGIAPGAADKLFQPFTQANDSTSRRFGGTGLGLSICRDLVKLMHGHVGVHSKEGEGSTFWFTALLQEAAGPRVEPAPAPRVENPPPHQRKLRVLIADDNAVNRLLATRQVQRLGLEAFSVPSGRQLLSTLDNQTFDLVLMDCQMPDMDGYEATANIRRREAGGDKHQVIVALTANALEGDRAQCLNAGMDDYLPKPVTKDALAKVLSQWLKV